MNQPFSWSQRRGVLPPQIQTASSSHNARNSSNPSNSPSRAAFSPTHPSHHASASVSSRHNISRNSSISSSSSPFSPSNTTGVQQQSGQQLLYSSRNRTIPSSSHSQLPSAVTSLAQGGASGDGGSKPRLSRGSPSLSQASADIGSPQPQSATSAPFSGLGGAASIDIAQVSILIARLDKEKDPRKHQEGIRSLGAFIDHNMDVALYTLRKLIKQYASRIFNGNDNSPDLAGSWTVLSNEVEAIRTKPDQAKKIADVIDINDGEPFRDFDLSTFMERFRLDPVAKCMLALALRSASKSDLKTKADAILSNNLQQMFMTILNPTTESGDDLTPAYLISLIDRLLQNPPRVWNEEFQSNLNFAVRARYEKLGRPPPSEVMSTMQLAELTGPSNDLVRLVQRTGERATSSLESCKDMLASAETRHINYTQVASVLLFMAITQNGEAYNPAIFVQALKEHRAGRRLDWQDVVHSFDRESLVISKDQFLAIYHALLPLAQEYENFDIQLLWGGQWIQIDTQLSFVVAFLSCTADELNADQIPRLRKAFVLEDFDDASEATQEYAARAVRHPLVSLDATAALFKMIFQNHDTYKHAIGLGIPEAVINPHTPYFVVASASVPQPWGSVQDQAFDQLFHPFLRRVLAGYNFVFHGLWKRDKQWLVERLIKYYTLEPPVISDIYAHAQEHGWLPVLTSIPAEFGLDLACYAHGHGEFDIEGWLQDALNANGAHFPTALASFLKEKADEDSHTQKNPHAPITTTPLMVDTVYTLLSWLSGVLPEDILISLNRIAIASYPRLINYGEGFDSIIKEDSKNGNAISPEADAAMQDHFKGLYNRETDVKSMIEALQQYKSSEDPREQELFACMIQGLFDEYSCFGEYPPDALATTAVLFGSIINFDLLSTIALQAGLSMVLEALQTATSREDKMFKFGLQALIHFQNKLTEWPSFCEKLLAIPDLHGTEVFRTAEEIVRSRMGVDLNGVAPNGITNGVIEEIASDASAPFTSLNVDPPLRPDIYEEPDEEIQDRVIFAVNNLSERNVDDKFRDIQEAVTEQYHHWFALHLVEDRAKSQPNYHELFLKLLRLFDSNWLWKEVIRETVVTCVRLLNADATLNNSNDRNQLKNLGSWLGRLTLGRDKPIRHANIAFVELLVEAYKSKRLLVVIPFVCRVLKAVANSKTFAPPNPWTEEILKILLEFYHHVEMKIQLKFEVEVLCKDIGADIKKIEPSVIIRESDLDPYNGDFPASIPDGLEGFNDLTLNGFARQNARLGDRFSPAAIISSLPDIGNRLYYPPNQPHQNAITVEQTRTAFQQAADLAIREIIFPVVERSVTIAGISASNLVMKDFATEADEEKFRIAAHSMVKSLAGSLALVTCREPLRMSMTNNIRALGRNIPGELPEGVILMFVNDNIDVVCKVVEEAAERQSVAVIDDAIQEGLQARSAHRSQASDEPFQWPQVHRFANMMPEPYKPSAGSGLTAQQLAIYENFGPTRAGTTHIGGQDARAQLPDFEGGAANLPTPSGDPAIPRQALQPSRGPGDMPEGRMNGFSGHSLEDLLQDLFDAAKAAPEDSENELQADSPVREAFTRLVHTLRYTTPYAGIDRAFSMLTITIFQYLWSNRMERPLEVEVAASLLEQLSLMFPATAPVLWQELNRLDDETLLANPKVTISLLSRRLLDRSKMDRVIANAIAQREPRSIGFFAELLDSIVDNEIPFALRTEFAGSIAALSLVALQEPSNEHARALLARLQGTPSGSALTPPASSKDQFEHIFQEWTALTQTGDNENTSVGFVQQLFKNSILQDPETTTHFFRICVAQSTSIFEFEEERFGSLIAAYLSIDAFARLLAMLVIHQGESGGAVKPTKGAYLDQLLCIMTMLQHQHFKERGEHSQPKIFFRLYSQLLFHFHDNVEKLGDAYDNILIVIAQFFKALQPRLLPMFSFTWLSLVSHRYFVTPILRNGQSQVANDAYVALVEIMLQKANQIVPAADNARDAAAYVVAILRNLLVLHHDFPEFLIENHARLCAAAPPQCTQVRNLINHVAPQGMTIPDPFAQNLQLDRMEELRQMPTLKIDLVGILETAGLKASLDTSLKSKARANTEFITKLEQYEHNASVMQAVALYTANQAISVAGSKSHIFNKSGAHFALLQSIANDNPEAASNLINAMVNQLRFPNAHTFWFCQALLEIFAHANGAEEEKHAELREAIATVLLERLMPMRPHPWGLVVTFMELVKNQDTYDFQSLPFVREHEDIWARPQGLQPLSAPGLPPPGMSGF